MIEVIKVLDKISGNLGAHDILKGLVDSQTLLVLSGGTSPDYRKMIVEHADILPGEVCLSDERFGMPYHDDSNELLLKNSGIIDFLIARDIKFHKILTGDEIEVAASSYTQVISELFAKFSKKVGVMGIGENLHTAGIFPESSATTSANLVVAETVEDRFPRRITLTIAALEQFSAFVVLVFGLEKRGAVGKMLDEKEINVRKYPAIFYRKSAIKSYLITDVDLA